MASQSNPTNRAWGHLLAPIFCLSLAFVNLFALYYVRQERYVYFWDFSLYWSYYQSIGYLLGHLNSAIPLLLNNIRTQYYNMLGVVPLTPFYIALGPSRLSFIIALANLYALPAVLILALFLKKHAPLPEQKISLLPVAVSLAALLFLPAFWLPLLLGFTDAFGVIVAVAVFMLAWPESFEKQKPLKLFWLGVLLALLVISRRWYAYWVIAFFIAITAERLIVLFPRHRFNLKGYLPLLSRVAVTGGISLAVFLPLTFPIAKTMLSTNYADVFSAYKISGNLFQFYMRLYNYLGPFISALFIISLACGIIKKETRSFSVFNALLFLSATLLFARVQDFGIQHYYLIIPSIIASISLFLMAAFGKIRGVFRRTVLAAFLLFLFAAQFALSFDRKTSDLVGWLSPLFSSERHYPVVRNDMGEIQRLLGTLAVLTHGGEEKIYPLASSLSLNTSLLQTACRQMNYPENFCGSVLYSSDIDRRDGFKMQFLSADYVVIAEPVQYQLSPTNQRVLGLLASEVTNKSGLGFSYERLPVSFTLSTAKGSVFDGFSYVPGGVQVYIYKKVRSFRVGDLERIQDTLLHYYPDLKDKFTIITP